MLSRKWLKSYRKLDKFYTTNNEWLNTIFEIPPLKSQSLVSNSTNIGRPVKMFMESSERTKRRKMNDLITSSNMSSPKILYAAYSKFQQHGQRSIVQHFKEVTSSPSRVFKIKNAIKKSNTMELIPYTADEALAFFVENNLTKQQYINIRLSAKNRNVDIYPSYASSIDARKLCYPDNCFISKTRCEIKLQDLLDHTSKRIFQFPIVQTHHENNFNSFKILYKWGCDSSNGQSPYKQIYENQNTCSDSDLFMFSIVPLQMHCLNNKNEKVVFWKNYRTSSTRFCRPIMFDFKKENVATTLLEVKAIEDQIKQMLASIIFVNCNEITVTHKLVFIMVDGKV